MWSALGVRELYLFEHTSTHLATPPWSAIHAGLPLRLPPHPKLSEPRNASKRRQGVGLFEGGLHQQRAGPRPHARGERDAGRWTWRAQRSSSRATCRYAPCRKQQPSRNVRCQALDMPLALRAQALQLNSQCKDLMRLMRRSRLDRNVKHIFPAPSCFHRSTRCSPSLITPQLRRTSSTRCRRPGVHGVDVRPRECVCCCVRDDISSTTSTSTPGLIMSARNGVCFAVLLIPLVRASES